MENSKVNPRETANILSILTFSYTLPLFKKGWQRDLEENDLYGCIESCRSQKCGEETEKQWNKSQSIYKLLWHRFGLEYSVIFLVTIIWTEFFSITQPYGVSHLISYFEENQTKITEPEAYFCAALVIFLKIADFFFWQHLAIYQLHCGIKIRTSLRSLLYRKILRLSSAAFSETNLGNIITILTKDITVIEDNLWILMEFVIVIIQTSTICYLIWTKMGNAAFIGIGLLVLTLPIQICLCSIITKLRLKVGSYTDKRLQITQETLSSIKIIKMYTWEQYFCRKINESRSKEVIVMMKTMYFKYAVSVVGLFTTKIAFLVLILSYLWMGYSTNTEMIFYVLSLYYDLTKAFGYVIPLNTSQAAEFRAAFVRLDKLLRTEETETVNNKHDNGKPSIELNNVKIVLKNNEILKNIDLKIADSGLFLLTGSVGSGKSSLLKTILQEYRLEGSVNIIGSISYASQDPWLFPATIRDNILFGQKFDETRYTEVVKVCALDYDFSLLEYGDQTLVADKGLNLSKGQQARINLARAIYKKSDIYLLDDSLTALDVRVQDFIFNECIKKFLKEKICILVTQNENYIRQSSSVFIMNDGRVHKATSGGISLEKNFSSNDKEASTISNKRTSVADLEKNNFDTNVYHEVKKIGKVELTVYKKYCDLGGGLFVFTAIISVFVFAQFCESYSDQLLTNWVDLQQKVIDLASNSTVNNTFYEDMLLKKDNTFSLYTMTIFLKTTMGLVKFYILLRFCRNASTNIHQVMSSQILNAIMSFFDTYYIGNILNRFSLDLYNIDENLPFIFPDLVSVVFICGGSIILLATVSWLLFLPAIVFVVGLILLRVVYIPTGRSSKRLEAANRSPLVGHINSSLDGLVTIRAFKAQKLLKEQFDIHQDMYTSAYFTLVYTNTAFQFYMDALCSIFATLVVARFLIFSHDISAGNVGLALTQVFMLTEFIQWGIKQWAELENYMTSVERVLEYTDIKNEKKDGVEMENFPREGSVTFQNVSLNYDNTTKPVLKDINFSVRPKEKIGIVGRTGAGKTSIISTLFGLYEYKGKILIDDEDVSNLSLNFLRKSIGIIPQDPVLFAGTVRENIDPCNKYTDQNIWQVIENVGVKNLIPKLDLQIEEGGSSFSAGQRQLICLARATIGKHKIVVLDEATANMDTTTDEMLDRVTGEILSDCTIFIIAHRLRSILNCDKVMVMAEGKIIEFDNPRALLENKKTVFWNMCNESGLEM